MEPSFSAIYPVKTLFHGALPPHLLHKIRAAFRNQTNFVLRHSQNAPSERHDKSRGLLSKIPRPLPFIESKY